MGLISVTRHICKSVARVRPGGVAPAAAGVPPVAGAGVKVNALDINQFAIKRPFVAAIIYMLRRTKAARSVTFGVGAAAFNRFATASS